MMTFDEGNPDASDWLPNEPGLARASRLAVANQLMTEALSILDDEKHSAAARLDGAIVELGLRPIGEGMPNWPWAREAGV